MFLKTGFRKLSGRETHTNIFRPACVYAGASARGKAHLRSLRPFTFGPATAGRA
jgi:hypothetical protein